MLAVYFSKKPGKRSARLTSAFKIKTTMPKEQKLLELYRFSSVKSAFDPEEIRFNLSSLGIFKLEH